jgi:hypothetical protein
MVISGRESWVWRFQDEKNRTMTPEQFDHMVAALIAKFARDNPEFVEFLMRADYKSQFEQHRKQLGFHKAKDFIKRKARAASIPARRFKFLWAPYRTGAWYFEAVDMVRCRHDLSSISNETMRI